MKCKLPLHRTTLALTFEDDLCLWAGTIGIGKRLRRIETGSFPLCDKSVYIPRLLAGYGRSCLLGIHVEERYVRHTRVSRQRSGKSGELITTGLRRLLPPESDPSEFSASCRLSGGEVHSFHTISAVSNVAFERALGCVRDFFDPHVVSSVACDLPFVLAYRDGFITGRHDILYTAGQYACRLEYRDSMLHASSVHVGDSESLVRNLDVSTESGAPGNISGTGSSMSVAGSGDIQTSDALHGEFSPAQDSSSVALAAAQEGTIQSSHFAPAGLALRIFYDCGTGFNLLNSKEITNRLGRHNSVRLKGYGTALAAAVVVLLLFISGLNVHATRRAKGIRAELDSLSVMAGESLARRRMSEKQLREARKMHRILEQQTNLADVLDRLGRAIPEHVTLSELAVSRNPGEPESTISINGTSARVSDIADMAADLTASNAFAGLQMGKTALSIPAFGGSRDDKPDLHFRLTAKIMSPLARR